MPPQIKANPPRPGNGQRCRKTSITLSPQHSDRLDQIERQYGTPRSEIIRRALDRSLDLIYPPARQPAP